MSPYRINITALLLFLTVILNAQNTSQHIVKRGETFASIAQKYCISEQQLRKANSTYSTCYAGIKLSIPQTSEKSNASTTINNVEKQSNNDKLSNSFGNQTKVKQEENQIEEKKNVAQAPAKKKRKNSFWKKVGNVFSTIGDINVAVADGFVESGLVSTESNAGSLISSFADLTHTLRGEETKYDSENMQSHQFGTDVKAQNKKEEYIVNQIKSLQNRYQALEKQAETIKNSKKAVYKQKSQMASKVLSNKSSKIVTGQNNVNRAATIKSQSDAYNAKADKQLRVIYKEMSEVRLNIHKLKSQLNQLRGHTPENDNYSSGSNKIECGMCHGLKHCTRCAGRGLTKSSKTGNWYNCPRCEGRGICRQCKGKGYFSRDNTMDPVN